MALKACKPLLEAGLATLHRLRRPRRRGTKAVPVRITQEDVEASLDGRQRGNDRGKGRAQLGGVISRTLAGESAARPNHEVSALGNTLWPNKLQASRLLGNFQVEARKATLDDLLQVVGEAPHIALHTAQILQGVRADLPHRLLAEVFTQDAVELAFQSALKVEVGAIDGQRASAVEKEPK